MEHHNDGLRTNLRTHSRPQSRRLLGPRTLDEAIANAIDRVPTCIKVGVILFVAYSLVNWGTGG